MTSATCRRAFERFADARSEERQRKAFETHSGIAKRAGATLDRDAWMKAHPRGSIEYADAFGPSGTYGRWIRARKPILQIGDTIFMHAGLNPERTITIDEINRPVEQEVRSWDDLATALERARLAAPFFTLQEIINAAQVEIGRIGIAQKTSEPLPDYVTQDFVRRLQFLMNFEKLALIEADGPLWYRGLATLPDDQQPAVEAMLKRHGARRIVTGHTPQLPGAASARGSAGCGPDRHRHAHQLLQGRSAVGARAAGRPPDRDLHLRPRAAGRASRRRPHAPVWAAAKARLIGELRDRACRSAGSRASPASRRESAPARRSPARAAAPR